MILIVRNIFPINALVCLFAGGKLGPETFVKGGTEMCIPGPILLLNADGSPIYEEINQDFILNNRGATDVSKDFLFVLKTGHASVEWMFEGRRFGIRAQWQPS